MRPLVGPGLAPMLPGEPQQPIMGVIVPVSPSPGLLAALWRYLTRKVRP